MDTFDFGEILMKLRHIRYGNLSFSAICPICGGPVEEDVSINVTVAGGYEQKPNATCRIHGRVMMPYDGTFGPPFGKA